jgi:short-subunit dehydrogenase
MRRPLRWSGATVIVTGATGGIGRATVRAALARGARVGCVARDGQRLAALARELSGSGNAIATAPADVGDAEALRRAIGSIAEQLGSPDVLVTCAGVGLFGPATGLDAADAERLMRVNYLGSLHAVQAVLPTMIARRSGRIVLVGSIAGRIGTPFEAAYSASKFAVIGFGEALAVELAPHGVGVSVVSPGPVATGFYVARGHPYEARGPRLLAPEAVADAIVRAAERNDAERILPGWLGLSVAIRHLLPSLYRFGVRRAFRRELARLAAAPPWPANPTGPASPAASDPEP